MLSNKDKAEDIWRSKRPASNGCGIEDAILQNLSFGEKMNRKYLAAALPIVGGLHCRNQIECQFILLPFPVSSSLWSGVGLNV